MGSNFGSLGVLLIEGTMPSNASIVGPLYF
jgi:hypothetical protein